MQKPIQRSPGSLSPARTPEPEILHPPAEARSARSPHERLFRDVSRVDPRRLLLIAPVDVGKALLVRRFDDVQQVICVRILEDAAHPLPVPSCVAGKVEHHGETPRRSKSLVSDAIS